MTKLYLGIMPLVFVVSAMAQEITPPASADRYLLQFTEAAGAYQLPEGNRTGQDYQAAQLYMQGLVQTHQSRIQAMQTLVPGISERVTDNYYRIFNGIAFNGSAEEAETLRTLPFVREVVKGERTEAFLDVSVPQINAPAFWNMPSGGFTGMGISVAVVDSGIDWTHADFGNCHDMGPDCQIVDGWDFVNNDPSPKDDYGHGTHVAAIIASNSATYRGVAPDVRLYAYKVLDSIGSGDPAHITAAMERISDPNQDFDLSDHLDVANFSLGVPGWQLSEQIGNQADALSHLGTVVVAAAGNSGGHAITTGPAVSKEAITVGSITDINQPSLFSSGGPATLSGAVKPDVVAPGGISAATGICAARAFDTLADRPSCGNDDSHVELSGTSMAAPHVAGLAALLKQANPDWRPIQIKYALRDSALLLQDPQSPDGFADYLIQGQGRVFASMQTLNNPPIARLDRVQNSDETVQFEARLGKLNYAPTETWSYRFDLGWVGIEPGSTGSVIANPQGWKHISEGHVVQSAGDQLALLSLPVIDKLYLQDGMHIARLQLMSGQSQVLSTDYYTFKVKNIVVTDPYQCDVQGRDFTFSGTLRFDPAESGYRIQYRPWQQSQIPWSEAGIVLPADGTELPTTATLGQFTAPENLATGLYEFRVIFSGTHGQVSSRDIGAIYIDRGLSWANPARSQRNRLITAPGVSAWDESHYLMPAIGDAGDGSGKLVVLPAQDESGTSTYIKRLSHLGYWRPPVEYAVPYFKVDPFSLHVSDFLGGPATEYAFTGAQFYPDTATPQRLTVQTLVNGTAAETAWNSDMALSGVFPVRADLNLDGSIETIIIQRIRVGWSTLLEIKILDSNLNSIATQPMSWHDASVSSRSSNLVVGNFDSDPSLEVAYVGLDREPGHLSGYQKLRIYNHDGSPVIEPVVLSNDPDDTMGFPQAAAADFNNDGRDEIVFALHHSGVAILDSLTGAYYSEGNGPGWPRLGSNSPFGGSISFPAISDLDGNGDLEIVIPIENQLHLLNSDGSNFGPGSPVALNGQEQSGALLSDLDGNQVTDLVYEDGSPRYGLCSFSLLHAKNVMTGEELEGFPKYLELASTQGKNLVDMNADGHLELISSSDGRNRAHSTRGSDPLTQTQVRDTVQMWPLPLSGQRPVGDWISMRGDFNRTGRYWGLAAPLHPEYEPIRGNGPGAIGWQAPANGNHGSNYLVQVSTMRNFEGATSFGVKGNAMRFQLPAMRQGVYWARVGSHENLTGRTVWSRAINVSVGHQAIPYSDIIE